LESSISGIDDRQIEEIKKAIAEADQGDFASDCHVEEFIKRWEPSLG
jgi:hypothetical protein